MKLTSNEKEAINDEATLLLIVEGIITWKEKALYDSLRKHAFYSSKTKKRNLSAMQVHRYEREIGLNKKRILEVFKKLERLKMIKPYYFVQTKNGLEEHTNLKDFDGDYGIGRKNIKFTKYKVLMVPGEKELRKKAIKKKS